MRWCGYFLLWVILSASVSFIFQWHVHCVCVHVYMCALLMVYVIEIQVQCMYDSSPHIYTIHSRVCFYAMDRTVYGVYVSNTRENNVCSCHSSPSLNFLAFHNNWLICSCILELAGFLANSLDLTQSRHVVSLCIYTYSTSSNRTSTYTPMV